MFISPKFQLRPGRAHKTVLRFSQLKPQKDNKPVERAGLSLFFIFGGRLIETTINPARSEHVVQIKHVVERFFFKKESVERMAVDMAHVRMLSVTFEKF